MSKPTHCYTARKQCGCLVGISVDDPCDSKDTAKWVAECIRAGMTIDRMTIEEGRAACDHWGCEHEEQPQLQTELKFS